MKTKLAIGLGLLAMASLVLALVVRTGESQPANAPSSLRIGIYSPTVQFPTSGARMSYMRTLGSAIQTRTGIKVNVASYSSLGALRGARPDFAIVEGRCYAVNRRIGSLLATARVGGGTTRTWALYSRLGNKLQSLKGRRLAVIGMGCNETAFVTNAMAASEISRRYFSSIVRKPSLTAAVADVATYKGAEAVFAPVGTQKGLTKVFTSGQVPNPAFVQMNRGLPKAVANKVRSAVLSFGASGAIGGWSAGRSGIYSSLAGRMGTRTYRGVFARPTPARVNVGDIVNKPKTLGDTKLTEVDQHFSNPPARQQ